MAKVEGYSCDVCSKYAEGRKTSTGIEKPEGWFVLHLPKTEHDSKDDRAKDICSAKCVITFGRERVAFEKGESGAPKDRSGHGARLPQEITDEYNRLGLTNAERIALGQQHRQHVADNVPDDNCLRCQYDIKRAEGGVLSS